MLGSKASLARHLSYATLPLIFALNTSCTLHFSAIDQLSLAERQPTTLVNFAFYYGYPNSLNSASLLWDNALVTDFFKQYGLVVFGAGLEDPIHVDHANLKIIAAGMKGATAIYGYVPLGITDALSMSDIQTRIDDWKNHIDVDGIFLDEAGFDFKLAGYSDADMRTRQKAAINYAHSLGLKVFINAWDPDDLFVKEPSDPISWSAGDKYLFESYIFSSAARQSFSDYRAKIDKLAVAMAQTGIEVYGVNTTAAPVGSFQQNDFDYMILSAAADGFQGISWGTHNFSATDSIMPYRTSVSLFGEFLRDLAPVVDSSAQTVTFTHPTGRVQLDYSSATFSLQ